MAEAREGEVRTDHADPTDERPELGSLVEPGVVLLSVGRERLLGVDLERLGRSLGRADHAKVEGPGKRRESRAKAGQSRRREDLVVRDMETGREKSGGVAGLGGMRSGWGGVAHIGMMECSRLTASSSVVILGVFFCLANSGDSRALIAPLPDHTNTYADGRRREGRKRSAKVGGTRAHLLLLLPSSQDETRLTLEVVDPLAVQQSTPDLGASLASEKVDDRTLLGRGLETIDVGGRGASKR